MEDFTKIDLGSGAVLAISRIDCDEAALCSRCNDSQREYVKTLSSAKRRLEWLNWQLLLSDMLDEECLPSSEQLVDGALQASEPLDDRQLQTSYRASGAPYIVGDERHITVSHNADYVAVLVSDSACGLDIESVDRNFDPVASRLLGVDEQHFAESLPLVWCAKEALYKFLEDKNLNMLSDIIIADICDDTITARVGEKCYNLKHLVYNKLNIVYLLKNQQSF